MISAIGPNQDVLVKWWSKVLMAVAGDSNWLC